MRTLHDVKEAERLLSWRVAQLDARGHISGRGNSDKEIAQIAQLQSMMIVLQWVRDDQPGAGQLDNALDLIARLARGEK